MPEDLSDREDLLQAAPLAPVAAAALCRRDESGDSCRWYHGVWPYFRLLGLVGSPWTHRAFFESAIAPLAASGQFRRVLVSGASDFAMVAVVRGAFRRVGAQPDLTVVDRCETPLHIHRWYAGRHGIELAAAAADIRSFTANGAPFDLICTHSFFGNFEPSLRAEVVSRWRDLLRPGGKLALVNRIRPGRSGSQGFTEHQAKAFIARARRAWEEQGEALGLSWPTLRDWAAEYTRRYRNHPVADAREFLALFEGRGFAVDTLEMEPSPPAREPTGPSTAGHAGRALLVHTRRAGRRPAAASATGRV
jgi:SAM-dependent methyltransferase